MRRYSPFAVALLIALAFFRGSALTAALIVITTVCLAFQIGCYLLPRKEKITAWVKSRAQRCKRRPALQNKARPPRPLRTAAFPEHEYLYSLLVLHVGHRITVYLRSVYPDAIWEWCGKTQASAIMYGGTLRIRLYHVPDFNYAEVFFDDSANLICNLMRVTPFAGLKPDAHTDAPPQQAPASQPQPQQRCDPEVWYDIVGQRALGKLAADLSSHGYGGFFIRDNGEVVVMRENKEIRKELLQSFPSSDFWPALAKLMEQSGYAPTIQKNGIAVALRQKGAAS